MTSPYQARFKLQVPKVLTFPVEGGKGFRTEEGPLEEHVVEVFVNVEKIVRFMGKRAVRSKGGSCTDGWVKVTHVRQRGQKQ